jgi:hypothetical protein
MSLLKLKPGENLKTYLKDFLCVLTDRAAELDSALNVRPLKRTKYRFLLRTLAENQRLQSIVMERLRKL